jgi:hypothetical protein
MKLELWQILTTVAVIAVIVYVLLAMKYDWYLPFYRREPNPVLNKGLDIPMTGWTQYERIGGGRIHTLLRIPSDNLNAVLLAVEQGLQNCIHYSQQYNPTWTRYMNTGDFGAVLMIKPMAFGENGEPCLLVPDMSGRLIKTAGTVLNVGYAPNTLTPLIVVAYQEYWNKLDFLRNAIWFEAEHAREWVNNQTIFFQKVGAGDIHPHWAPTSEFAAMPVIERLHPVVACEFPSGEYTEPRGRFIAIP